MLRERANGEGARGSQDRGRDQMIGRGKRMEKEKEEWRNGGEG